MKKHLLKIKFTKAANKFSPVFFRKSTEIFINDLGDLTGQEVNP